MSILIVDCSNCHTPLNLPPAARSIRCAICQAVTPIADSGGGSSFPTSNSGDQIQIHPYMSSSLSPYNNQAPMTVSGMSLFPGLAMDVNSPSPYNHAPAGSPASVHGRKKAVIVGVSYKLTRYELKGCINDAKYMKHLLISRFQFPEASIIMLTEEETEDSRIPTIRNIRNALDWLIQGCEPGDSLVFHYSGHGSRQRNLNGDEIDGYDETLCPLDFETEGTMIADEINARIVKPLPVGVKLHAIIDSCHSGTVLDLPFLCRINSSGEYVWEDHRPKSGIWKGSNGGEVISISGCDDDQKSADTSALSKITSTGAMTFCFIQAIEHGNANTYGTLLTSMRNAIRNDGVNRISGFTQVNGQMGKPWMLSSYRNGDRYAREYFADNISDMAKPNLVTGTTESLVLQVCIGAAHQVPPISVYTFMVLKVLQKKQMIKPKWT